MSDGYVPTRVLVTLTQWHYVEYDRVPDEETEAQFCDRMKRCLECGDCYLGSDTVYSQAIDSVEIAGTHEP